MDKYSVKLLSRAYRDLDKIYGYIATTLCEERTAENMISDFEKTLLSLEAFPECGVPRKTDIFAQKGYRQLFVGNFTVVYRIGEVKHEVVVVTVRYSRSQF